MVQRQQAKLKEAQDISRPRIETAKAKKVWKDMHSKLECLHKIIANMEQNIDPKNYTVGEWHDQMIYTVFNFHPIYGAIEEFKNKINSCAQKYSKQDTEKTKGIKVINELPYCNAFLVMYQGYTEQLWNMVSTFDPKAELWCEEKLKQLNVFTVQFMFLRQKMQLSMNYFIDYSMTESWNELMNKEVRNKIKEGTYEFPKIIDPQSSSDFILSQNKFKSCS